VRLGLAVGRVEDYPEAVRSVGLKRVGWWSLASWLVVMASVHAQTTPVLVPPQLRVGVELSLPPDLEPTLPGAEIGLLLTIDVEGRVTQALVEQPLRDDLDALATLRAGELRFAPALRDGVPVASRVRFRFVIPGAPNAEAEPALPIEVVDLAPTSPAPAVAAKPASYSARAVVDRPAPGAATQIRLRQQELTTVPGTFGEPLRVVATLPGVARTPFGLGYFLVRGASFENTGFFVDGFPVPILYHLGAGPAVLSSRLVQGLDFYPGGYPASYGRFLGGVIALKTGPPPSDGARAELEVDLFRASALAVVPFQEGRGTLTLAYRRSYFDLILPLVTDGIELFYQDWQARLDYRVLPNLELSVFAFGAEDSLSIATSTGAGVTDATSNTDLNYRFQRVIGSLKWRITDNARLTWSSTIGFDRTLLGRVSPGDSRQQTRLGGLTLGERVELEVRTGEWLTSSVGVDALALAYDVSTPLPVPDGVGRIEPPINSFDSGNTTELSLSPVTLSVAPYIQEVLRVGAVELTGGVRADALRYADVTTLQLDPRGVSRFKLSEVVTLKAATGLFTQPPLPFQIDRNLGNPELRPQRSWQSSGGIELTLPYAFEVQSQLFYSRMQRLGRTTAQIVEQPDGSRRRLVFVDDGEGRAYGWELLLRRKLERGLYGWLSYTLSWSERIATNGETVPFLFDQRHVMNLALSYQWTKWRFGARLQLATGRPTRPLQGASYDVDENEYDEIRSGLTSRIPAFQQLDVRVDRDFSWGQHVRGSWYLDIMNVLNASNAESYLYQYDFQKRARLPSLPILPTLGMRLEYE